MEDLGIGQIFRERILKRQQLVKRQNCLARRIVGHEQGQDLQVVMGQKRSRKQNLLQEL